MKNLSINLSRAMKSIYDFRETLVVVGLETDSFRWSSVTNVNAMDLAPIVLFGHTMHGEL